MELSEKKKRWLKALLMRNSGCTYKEIGQEFNIGVERSRQIIIQANQYLIRQKRFADADS